MKKIISSITLLVFAVGITSSIQSCKKQDPCAEVQTYTYYIPVYQPASVVRANIKSNAPRSVRKPGKIYIKGDYIFLNEINRGIHVINNSNPAAPVNVSFISIPGNVDIAVKGNTLYADFYAALVVMDISNPLDVKVKKFVERIFPERSYYGYHTDSTQVITDWIAKTESFAMSCDGRRPFDGVLLSNSDMGYSPTATSSPVGISGSLARFSIINDHLYTVSEDSLRVISIAAAHEPVHVNSVHLGWGIETLFPMKDKLFIGSRTGMFIYGLQNPVQPIQLGTFTHVRTCDPVIADGDFAYVTLFSGNECAGFTNQLDVLNIADIHNPTLVKTYQLSGPRGLGKDGNLLFICDAKDGLLVLNAAMPQAITVRKMIPMESPMDVIAHDNIALVIAADGLYQYDYSNPADIRLVSKIAVR